MPTHILLTILALAAFTSCATAPKPRQSAMPEITLQQLKTDFRGELCYTNARGAVTPEGFAIITTQPLRLTGNDVIYGMEMTTSNDFGKTWSPIRKSKTLLRQDMGSGYSRALCDATPMYHKKSGKLLLLGHDAVYLNDDLAPAPQPRHTLWSVFNREKNDWEPFREITMPDNVAYYECGNGAGQSVELENGDILIPVYYMSREEAKNPWGNCYHAMIMRCSFDGKELKLLELGNSITVPVPRGLGEPSLIRFKDKFFISLRNDHDGYVSYSSDGMKLEEPRPLIFDDGSSVGNYCTQQHWITCGGKLYMVYTRKNAGNDHVFRHRAPLFMAEFDTEKLCLIRATEQIAVPERGARLGNFGCTRVSDNESWVIASEWMQTNPPNPFDWTVCAKYGSDNSIFIAKVTCDKE